MIAAFLLALLAAFAAATHIRATAREAAAEAAFPPEGRFVTVEGRRVHAVVMGSGPDLVLIHGLSGNARDFTFGFAPMMAQSYRVIAFDRPGLGFSDPLPPGADGLAEQARHLAAAARLLGAERPLVLGQSYGGAVALAWAVAEPDSLSGLVTVAAPSHSWTTPMPWLYRVNSHPLGAALFVPLLTAWVPDRVVQNVEGTFAPQAMPPGYDRHIGAPLTLRRRSMRVNARHRARLKADIEAMTPAYPALALPFELVHGTADDTVSILIHAERMLNEAPVARLTRLDGIGHMPHHAAPEAVAAAVDRAAARAAAE